MTFLAALHFSDVKTNLVSNLARFGQSMYADILNELSQSFWHLCAAFHASFVFR